MDLKKDYYKILGLNKDTSEKEIKKEYRKKANKYHPDKYGGDGSEFKDINEAFQILGNKDKKHKYDHQSPHGKNYDPSSGFNSFFTGGEPFAGGDPFAGFNFSFGGSGFDPFDIFFNRKEFHENLDITINKNITLSDVYNNKEINIKYKRKITCDVCRGTGFDPDSESYGCDVCDGSGRMWEPTTGYMKCKYCQGKGKIHTGECKKCKGNKVIDKEEEFNINNVYRIKNSDKKYLKGYGNQSKHYINKKGNLILNINYINNENYLRRDDGLYYKLNVHYENAINGSEIEYKHLDNKIYKIKIPPKTKDGDKLKMENKGLLIDNKTRQDFFLLVNIIIDYNEINK